MRKKKMILLLAIVFCVCGCLIGWFWTRSGTMKNGYYTAEMSEYDHGWKEYVCILVKNGSIISIEFNAKDPSGFIKAWDNSYMKNMKLVSGTYPNEYTRLYGSGLIETQDIEKVDMVSGASNSGGHFYKLVNAAVEQAKKGNPNVKLVTE